jgi:hypothetical protein
MHARLASYGVLQGSLVSVLRGAACLLFVLASQPVQLTAGHVVKQSLSTVQQQLLEQSQCVNCASSEAGEGQQQRPWL